MKIGGVILALSALGHSTRFEIFRILAAHEPEGLAVRTLADMLAKPQSGLYVHFNILARAKLVTRRRHTRHALYRAELDHFGAIALFLLRHCSGGPPELRGRLIAELSAFSDKRSEAPLRTPSRQLKRKPAPQDQRAFMDLTVYRNPDCSKSAFPGPANVSGPRAQLD